jgi:hypothetical protein
VLLCARFPGAFTDDAWKGPAVELIAGGLVELGADQVTFEVGALLVGRPAMSAGWFAEPTGLDSSSERDARRAIEIAERVDSPYLLSRAVESLIAHALGGGLCGAGELAERLVDVSESLSDRAEVHEGLITAAITLARAGRHGRAHEIARRATRDSERLSPHQSIHAAAAEVMCLLPAGRFEELLRMTTHVPAVVRDEGGRLCQVGALALAGRALALFERGERDAAEDALALLEAAPPPVGLSTLRPLAIEIARPLAGLERTRRRAAELEPAASRAAQLYKLRLDLQLSALAADWGALGGLVAEARELAVSGCAPTLGWIADWADAVARASAGDGADAVRRATRAAERSPTPASPTSPLACSSTCCPSSTPICARRSRATSASVSRPWAPQPARRRRRASAARRAQQAQAVERHEQRHAHVGGDGHHERDQSEGGEHDEDRLDGQRGDDVLAHHAGGLAGAADCAGQAGEVVGHECDVGGFEGGVGAGGAHRDADVSGGERGCVVDAVADHRDRAVFAVQGLDGAQLVLGQQSCPALVGADPL